MKIGTLENGEDVAINLRELLKSRLLIFAGSNGGKSWLIRRILEQSFKDIQHIVMDVEGDFYTLREQFKYILAGNDSEINPDMPIDPNAGAVMARWIMELRASIIFDLSSLGVKARVQFVNDFSAELLELPKKMRHPVLYVVDEIQDFCDESERIASTATLNDLAAKARKRGICTIYATQRIAEVHKTAISQCHNKLIGLASLDIDKKRAAVALGFAARQADMIEDLNTGQFFARGPAISKKVIKVHIANVATTHPEAGQDITPPKPVSDEAMNKAVAMLRKAMIDVPAPKAGKATPESGRQYKEEIEKKDVEIAGLKDVNKGLENLTNEQQKQIKELQTEAEIIENLRKLLLPKQMMNGYTPSGDITINQDNVEVRVTETLKEQTLDEKTIEGKLLLLIANKEFAKPLSMKALQTMIVRNWGGDTSSAFYQRLKPALTRLSQRPYQYVKQDAANNWAPTGKNIKEAATA